MLSGILGFPGYFIARIHDPLADTLSHKRIIGTLSHLFLILTTHLFDLFDCVLGLGDSLLAHPGSALIEFLAIEAVIPAGLLKSLDLESQMLILILQTSTLLKDLIGEFHG